MKAAPPSLPYKRNGKDSGKDSQSSLKGEALQMVEATAGAGREPGVRALGRRVGHPP